MKVRLSNFLFDFIKMNYTIFVFLFILMPITSASIEFKAYKRKLLRGRFGQKLKDFLRVCLCLVYRNEIKFKQSGNGKKNVATLLQQEIGPKQLVD